MFSSVMLVSNFEMVLQQKLIGWFSILKTWWGPWSKCLCILLLALISRSSIFYLYLRLLLFPSLYFSLCFAKLPFSLHFLGKHEPRWGIKLERVWSLSCFKRGLRFYFCSVLLSFCVKLAFPCFLDYCLVLDFIKSCLGKILPCRRIWCTNEVVICEWMDVNHCEYRHMIASSSDYIIYGMGSTN